MKHFSLLPLIFVLLAVQAAKGQNILLPQTGDTALSLLPGNSITLLDPGGTTDYPDFCDITITIYSTAPAITVSGNYSTEYNADFLYLYDGNGIDAPQLGFYSGLGQLNVAAYNGALTFRFLSNATFSQGGFSLTVSACNKADGEVMLVRDSTVTDSSVIILWSDTSDASLWTVRYGTSPQSLTQHVTTTTPSASLSGLSEYTQYYYRIYRDSADADGPCTVHTYHFKTLCSTPPSPCIDYTDLYSCYVSAHYGIYHNPDTASGIVDYGPASPLSRHTIHIDTSERDARTGYQLRTIPKGYSSSVRLGNWQTGSQAESLTYYFPVDTNNASLLIMRYAVVLQDPDHPDAEQPRFTFRILDEQGATIDASCLSANFIAGSSLGWNSYTTNPGGSGYGYSYVIWKDWTALGFDLSALHGQTIQIKLTTYDCALQNHYGYAYFVFDCERKQLQISGCGNNTDNTFTAPEGFNYRWFNNLYAGTTLSSYRSLHVTQPGTYTCAASFIGAPDSAACTFYLTATASARIPVASYTRDSIPTDSCNYLIRFTNHSVISHDSSLTLLSSEPCDAILWQIDSLLTFSDDSIKLLLEPGWHTVQLVASLSNGTCNDTVSELFYLPDPCFHEDTVTVTLCQGGSYLFFDTLLYDAGIYVRDSLHLRRTLILTILPNTSATLHDTVVENNLPYSVAGLQLDNSLSDTVFYLTADNGCDSTLFFSLIVWPNISSIIDTTLCQDNLPLEWNGETFSLSDFNLQEASPTATKDKLYAAGGIHGEDSTLTMMVTLLKNSSLIWHDTVVENDLPVSVGGLTFNSSHADTNWTIPNAAGCDSLLTYSLHVWPNVEAIADSSLCEGLLPFSWNGHVFTQSDTVTLNLATLGIYALHGEDSILTMRLHVLFNSSYSLADTVVENGLPTFFGGCTFYADVSDTSWTIPNAVGCDSLLHYSLHVWSNLYTSLDSTVCSDQLPLVWYGALFSDAGSQVLQYSSVNGADSTVTLTLTVLPYYEQADTAILCQGEVESHGYAEPGNYTLTLSTIHGCDSIIHLHVIVHPTYNQQQYDTICSNQSVDFDGTSLNTAGHYEATHLSVEGCDSLLTLDLTVYPTSRIYDHAVVCNGGTYTWIDGNSYSSSTYEPTITYTDQHGCDSIHQLILDIDLNGFKATMEVSPLLVTPTNPEVRLRDLSQSSRRTWYIGDEQDTSRTCTFNFPTGLDSLNITMVAHSTIGCVDTARSLVRCDRATFWAPNAFTPDESQNNRFAILSNDLTGGEVYIYDRAGLFVARFDLLTGFWDGMHNGAPCPQGTYIWVLTYTTLTQPRQSQQAKGTVTLLR